MIGNLHPMPLGFEVTVHRLFPKTWHFCQACCPEESPEN
jgi:hypothetical protein